jgi:SHNi-TPR.
MQYHSEKFDQAITDYEAGLALKATLLPLSSRQIAEAHYKLSMVLDLTPGRLADAITHAEKALESVESRLAELRGGQWEQLKEEVPEVKDFKSEGKSMGRRLVRDNLVHTMTNNQIQNEIKELSGLKVDLALKVSPPHCLLAGCQSLMQVEELKTMPSESLETTAPVLAAQALDKALNAGPSSEPVATQTAVNDLTSMVVKKKKKVPEDSSTAKRKADDAETPNSEKKAKLDTPES